MSGEVLRIGVAGLGRMGSVLAERELGAGHEVTVWNRSSAPADRLRTAGAAVADSPAELASACDVLISCLYDEAALDAVYLGPLGLTAVDLAGRILIDTSTVAPSVAHRLGPAVAARSGAFLDAPLLGTTAPARQGQLVVMAGGGEATLKAARPALAPLARAVWHMGPAGSGYAAKLAVNNLLASYWSALGDSLGLAARYNIDRTKLLGIIADGPAALAQLPLKLPILSGEAREVAFSIAACGELVGAILEAARDVAFPMPSAEAISANVDHALAAGWGERDVAALALVKERKGPKT